VGPKPEELELSKCLPLFTLPTWRQAAFFSNSLPIGTTRTSAKIQNVASVFDRFGGRYMVGAFWFLPILRIGPIPTRATPWINARSRAGHRSSSPSQVRTRHRRPLMILSRYCA
jgi:hypothetical protein